MPRLNIPHWSVAKRGFVLLVVLLVLALCVVLVVGLLLGVVNNNLQTAKVTSGGVISHQLEDSVEVEIDARNTFQLIKEALQQNRAEPRDDPCQIRYSSARIKNYQTNSQNE